MLKFNAHNNGIQSWRFISFDIEMSVVLAIILINADL